MSIDEKDVTHSARIELPTTYCVVYSCRCCVPMADQASSISRSLGRIRKKTADSRQSTVGSKQHTAEHVVSVPVPVFFTSYDTCLVKKCWDEIREIVDIILSIFEKVENFGRRNSSRVLQAACILVFK